MSNNRNKLSLIAVLCACLLCAAPLLARMTPQSANAVTISNNQFTPKTSTVPAGATITWTNKEAKPHTVTADDDSFASKVMKENDAFEFQFTKPGTYNYHCAFHGSSGGGGMAGTVVVTAKK